MFKVLSNGRTKSISYKELSTAEIQYIIDGFKKANSHREATLRGENYKCGWFHKRYLKKEIKKYKKRIEILSEELKRRRSLGVYFTSLA